MGTRRVGRVLHSRATIATLLVLLVPASAMADRHTADVGGGGGRAGRSSLWGIGLMGDWIPKGGDWPCHPTDRRHNCTLSVAGEFSWAQGDHEGGTLTQYVFQLGPRIMWNTPLKRHVQPYSVLLFGFTNEQNGQDRTSFSTAVGGGADFPLTSERHPPWVFRGQVTWNWIDNGRSDDSYWHVGFSLVYRFEKNSHSSAPPSKP